MNQDIVVWQPGITLVEMERKIIVAAYKFYRSNKTMTAQSLGIAIRTLDTRLQSYEESTTRKTPSRQEIHDGIQKDLTKTGEGGHDPRGEHQAKSEQEFRDSGKTGPGGRMSDQQIAELRQAKLARMEKAAGILPHGQQASDETESGIHVQSTSEVSSEPAVSVSEREEVQEVPHELAAKTGNRQRSGNVQSSNEGRANQIHSGKTARGGR